MGLNPNNKRHYENTSWSKFHNNPMMISAVINYLRSSYSSCGLFGHLYLAKTLWWFSHTAMTSQHPTPKKKKEQVQILEIYLNKYIHHGLIIHLKTFIIFSQMSVLCSQPNSVIQTTIQPPLTSSCWLSDFAGPAGDLCHLKPGCVWRGKVRRLKEKRCPWQLTRRWRSQQVEQPPKPRGAECPDCGRCLQALWGRRSGTCRDTERLLLDFVCHYNSVWMPWCTKLVFKLGFKKNIY